MLTSVGVGVVGMLGIAELVGCGVVVTTRVGVGEAAVVVVCVLDAVGDGRCVGNEVFVDVGSVALASHAQSRKRKMNNPILREDCEGINRLFVTDWSIFLVIE